MEIMRIYLFTTKIDKNSKQKEGIFEKKENKLTMMLKLKKLKKKRQINRSY